MPQSSSTTNTTNTNPQIPSLPHKIEEGWRRKICEWMFEVVDHYKFDREVVSVALYYLDRFVTHNLTNGEEIGRREFQLLAICCLYTAMKVCSTQCLFAMKHLIAARGTEGTRSSHLFRSYPSIPK